jgi:hypothetical protein
MTSLRHDCCVAGRSGQLRLGTCCIECIDGNVTIAATDRSLRSARTAFTTMSAQEVVTLISGLGQSDSCDRYVFTVPSVPSADSWMWMCLHMVNSGAAHEGSLDYCNALAGESTCRLLLNRRAT